MYSPMATEEMMARAATVSTKNRPRSMFRAVDQISGIPQPMETSVFRPGQAINLDNASITGGNTESMGIGDSSFSYRPSSDSKPTFKLGLEFRPNDHLLIRGNYATAFRAPDMGYIFTGGNGFFTTQTDYYKCEVDPGNCNLYQGLSVEGNQVANPDLKSINADSFGFGFVASSISDITRWTEVVGGSS